MKKVTKNSKRIWTKEELTFAYYVSKYGNLNGLNMKKEEVEIETAYTKLRWNENKKEEKYKNDIIGNKMNTNLASVKEYEFEYQEDAEETNKEEELHEIDNPINKNVDMTKKE